MATISIKRVVIADEELTVEFQDETAALFIDRRQLVTVNWCEHAGLTTAVESLIGALFTAHDELVK